MATALVLAGCGDDEASDGSNTDTAVGVSVTYTPDEGTAVDIWADVEITCEDDRLRVMSDMDVEGDRLIETFFIVEVDLGAVAPGDEVELPVEGDGTDESVIVFVAEKTPDDGSRGNETASTAPGASGTVLINDADCGDEPQLDAFFDEVRLGSELGMSDATFDGAIDIG